MRTPVAAHLRHLGLFLRLGTNPAATVYEAIGPDFFLAPAPGWLNLGLWEPGDHGDALAAVTRLVRVLAGELETGGVVLDVGNGLGAQEPVIAQTAAPSQLVALNITKSQLEAGRNRLDEAGAIPVNGDATRIPVKDGSVDGIISVEAAFHFPSRAAFFREARRVLRPGGVLSFSDVSVERRPVAPDEVVAGAVNLRVWGLRARNMINAAGIEADLAAAGFRGIQIERVGARVIPPAVRHLRSKLSEGDAPLGYRAGSRFLLATWSLLYSRKIIEYLLIRATAP